MREATRRLRKESLTPRSIVREAASGQHHATRGTQFALTCGRTHAHADDAPLLHHQSDGRM